VQQRLFDFLTLYPMCVNLAEVVPVPFDIALLNCICNASALPYLERPQAEACATDPSGGDALE
jgi:hypothetical protein